ncbi:hypothetical protein [uncultured Deinococcus sp.]|uniref:hypothetical protein n=1 Tax=uncultured Deinococcus sp. TaxID=158789 RepID=UPI0025F3DE21|nr:hypothetical protein [uncultured Deinococcus sp.]
MIFSPAPLTIDYDVLHLTSETGVWEFGVHRVMFGMRVCANWVGSGVYVMDYCAGDRLADVAILSGWCRAILEAQPETLTHAALEALLPGWDRRPVVLDDRCMRALASLAAQARGAA